MKKLITLTLSIISSLIYAYNMPTSGSANVTTCTGTVYDPGGTNDYSNSTTSTYTIYPGTTGMAVSLSFSSFYLESSYDYLRIYDGTTSSATLLKSLTGSTIPSTVTASIGNASGALTLVFTSDGSSVYPGFVASISCVTPVVNNYCTTSLGGGGSSDYISNVSISGTSFNNTSTYTTQSDGSVYSSFSETNTTTANLLLGSTYTLNVTSYTTSMIESFWIDYNRNGLFESTEWTQITTSSANYLASSTFTVPANSSLGKTGLRIRTRAAGNSNGSSDACSNFASGETEDYTITISSPTPCSGTPNAGTSVSTKSSVCAGSPFTLSLQGIPVVTGLTYQWQSSINNSTWVNETNATSSTYTVSSLSSSTYYRCVVGCASNFASSTTTYVQLNTSGCEYAVPYTGSTTLTTCNAVITDHAGSGVNYSSGADGYMVINPGTTGQRVSLSFSSFNLESCCDYVRIYDGTSTSATLLGSYNGSSLPPTITATNTLGALTIRFSTDGSGQYSGFVANVTCVLPCNSSGTATIQTTVTDACSDAPFILSVTGSAVGGGASYQWQTSTNGSTWAALTGATSSSLSTSLTSSTYYRAIVYCQGNPITTNTVFVQLKTTNCYCSTNLGGYVDDDYITNVNISGTDLNNSSTYMTQLDGSIYTSYPESNSTTATLVLGNSYTLNVTTFSIGVIESVWIDYNRNGLFESTEWYQMSTNSTTNLLSLNFTVPANAQLGKTVMRIRTRASGNANGSTDACSNFGSGETEDYIVTLSNSVDVKDNLILSSLTSLVPNPATDFVTILIDDNNVNNATVLISDLSGKKVYESKNKQLMSSGIELNVSDFSKGMYLVTIQTEKGNVVKSLIVE